MNKRRFKIIEPAEIELDEAHEYYDCELKGLGDRFLSDFKNAVNRIIQFPKAWSLVLDNVRKCKLKKFPYSIVYAIEDELIIILAVAHHHRQPYYWIDRLKEI